MIVTSNTPFSKWGEIFGDDMAATAMIDRLIHHSEILSLKGDSYRLRGKDLDTRIGAKPPKSPDPYPSGPPRRAQNGLHSVDPAKGSPSTDLKRPSPLQSSAPRGSAFATTSALHLCPADGQTSTGATYTGVVQFSTCVSGPIFDQR